MAKKSELAKNPEVHKVVVYDAKSPFDLNVYQKGAGSIQLRVMAGGKRTLLHRKMINSLFNHASKEGLEHQHYVIRTTKFKKDARFDSNDIKYLKDVSGQLTEFRVQFDIISENVQHVGTANLFSVVSFRSDGSVYFEIPELTKRMIANPERFALLNMQIQGEFDTLAGHILWENCLLYTSEGMTPFWDIPTWKAIFDIDDDENPTYKDFRYFNSKIIKTAVNEVNKVADILVEPVYQKLGRAVDRIAFKIERKPASMHSRLTVDNALLLQERLVDDFGITEKVAMKLVQLYSPEHLLGNLEYVEQQFEAGKVTDLPAFTVRAIEEDYRPKVSKLQKKVQDKQELLAKKKEEQDAEKEETVAQERAQIRERSNRAKTYYDGLDEFEKTGVLDKFQTYLREKNNTVFLQFKKNGLESMAVVTLFHAYIIEDILKE